MGASNFVRPQFVKRGALAWIAFLVAVMAAWAFASHAWMLGPWYMRGQLALFAVTVVAGTVVLRLAPLTWSTILTVLAGVVLGNFALLELGAMTAIWAFGRFAP
jgi:hypothetical protein